MSKDNLAFLDSVLGPRLVLYRESKWLVSDFDENVWEFSMTANNVQSFRVDFNKTLLNGTQLTDKKNRALLQTFKYWLNASVHPDNTRGRGGSWADATANGILRKVLCLIDYFLINDKHLKTSDCGLSALSSDNMKQLADSIFSNKLSEEHIYDWSKALSDYLSNRIVKDSKDSIIGVVDYMGLDFTQISEEQLRNCKLDIPLEKIPAFRLWLWENDLYSKDKKGDFQYSIKTKPIAEEIYGPFTLMGAASTKSMPSILSLGGVGRYTREYPAAPVRTENDQAISYTGISTYRTAMSALLLLKSPEFSNENLLVPDVEVVNAFINYWPDKPYSSRFATLPSKIVLKSMKDAIEFHCRYAAPLLRSVQSLLPILVEKRAQLEEGKSSSLTHIMSSEEFRCLLDPVIEKLGTSGWTSGKEIDRFASLRSNKGLGELIRVHNGGVQVVVGALMARRQSELSSLKAEECIDETRRWLIFNLSKSTRNLEGRRAQVARPIDEMAIEMIETLIDLQKVYLKAGLIENIGYLFDTVSLNSPVKLVKIRSYRQSMAQSLDMFCDYFETAVREDGKRYYIRTHQLRRFFALSFFWGSGFGGMDTLRWFMGHTDPEHLYHYITENTPGEVLRHAKAQFLSESIEEHASLRDLIFSRYGTKDFTLLNTDELEDYMSELILAGEVDVEPEFIEDKNGRSYKLLVLVRGINNDR